MRARLLLLLLVSLFSCLTLAQNLPTGATAAAMGSSSAGSAAPSVGSVSPGDSGNTSDNGPKNIFADSTDKPLFAENGNKGNRASSSEGEKKSGAETARTNLANGNIAAGPMEPNEFQRFVQATTGQALPLYGSNFFAASRDAVPGQGLPVPLDYRLAPGDEITVRVWGAVFGEYTGSLDREGNLALPKVGTIALSGVRAGDAESAIRSAISRYYQGFNISVSLGKLRGITVYVVGQAKRPGTYSVSSLTTVIGALLQSGGPNGFGSMRRVQVKRDGRQVAELDLYAFLSKGDKAADIRLLDGDVIVIPAAAGHVALLGELEAPAVFELKGQNDNLQAILELAGGLPVLANPQNAVIERLDASASRPRTVEDFPLVAENLKRTLKPGDVITIQGLRPEFANAVVLRGVIDAPLRRQHKDGMKVTDLIPNREFLLSKAVVQRQNELRQMQGESIGNKYDLINWDYAVVERLNRAQMKQTLLTFNLARALDDPKSADNLELKPGDTVTLFSASDVRLPQSKKQVYVRLEGEVQRPGVYLVEPGESLANIVVRAGGFTADAFPFGAEFLRESVRKGQQENLDRVIRKLEQQQMAETAKVSSNISVADSNVAQIQQTRLAKESELRDRFLQRLKEAKSNGRIALNIPVDLGTAAGLPTIKLENGDRFYVPNRPDFVQVMGAVNSDAAFIWQPGRSISDYLAQTSIPVDADRETMFILRANGTVVGNSDRWITSISGLEAMPGDIVVLPAKVDRETFWTAFTRNAKDLTQILANFGLGAAAIKTLR